MTLHRYIVWRNSEVAFLDDASPHQGEMCVDTGYGDPLSRYGEYAAEGWSHVPLKEFPKEFRMHLLLLGVS